MIYIVVPVYNRKTFTRACLKSLMNQSEKAYHIIVVDHGSTDGTSSMIQDEFPEVDVIEGDDSMWWTAATNLGIKRVLQVSASEEDMILTLNNDLVVNQEYLHELLTIYNSNKPCIVGSVSVDINNPNKISYIGGTWNRYTAKFRQNKIIELPYQEVVMNFNHVFSDLLPGRGTLFPVSVFKQVGLYDEYNFPHYFADLDLSLRARIQGYKLIVSTKAIIYSHLDETGLNPVYKKKNLTYWYKYFTSIRSPNNIRNRWNWSKKHGPFPVLYFTFDMGRIVLGHLKKRK